MTTSIGSSNVGANFTLPGGDTRIPGLNVTWSQLMLLVTPGDGTNGSSVSGIASKLGLELPPPILDIDELTAELQGVQQELASGMTTNQKTMLQVHTTQRRESMDDSIQKMKDYMTKVQQALADQKSQSVAKWFEAVFGLIGAVFAAVAVTTLSGGAAVAAGVAAVAGAVMALMDVVDQAMQTAGVRFKGPDGQSNLGFSIQGIVQAAVETAAKNGNLSPDQVAEVTAKVTEAVNIALTVLIVACSLGGASGAIKSAAGAIKDVVSGESTISSLFKGLTSSVEEGTADADSSSKLEVVASAVTVTADLGSSGSIIAAGALQIETAGIERDANDSKALADLLNSAANYMTMFIKADGDSLTAAAKGLNDSIAGISDMITDYFTAQSQITSSMA